MDEFQTSLMRMIAAELRLLNGLTVAREMFGKSYFALGVGERLAVDQAVSGTLAAMYQGLTKDYFATPGSLERVGFGLQHPGQSPTAAGTVAPPNPQGS
jgi:hypothetical protein